MSKAKRPRRAPRAGPKRAGHPRAARSYFGRHLARWLAQNAGVDPPIFPANQNQLYEAIEGEGEKASRTGPGEWVKSRFLPEARVVSVIERLMGVPFVWLDKQKDPPSPLRAILFSVALDAANRDDAALLASLRKRLSDLGVPLT